MTEQEVVFCRSVFKKIYYLFQRQELWDNKKYYQNLFYLKIKTTKSNKSLFQNFIQNSPGFSKLFRNHLFSTNFEVVNPSSNTIFVKNKGFNELCNIGESTLDKIIHTEYLITLKILMLEDLITGLN